MYLIWKVWADSLENEIGHAFGYSPFAYTDGEKEAREFCEKGEKLGTGCWVTASHGAPIYKYEEIKPLKALV